MISAGIQAKAFAWIQAIWKLHIRLMDVWWSEALNFRPKKLSYTQRKGIGTPEIYPNDPVESTSFVSPLSRKVCEIKKSR